MSRETFEALLAPVLQPLRRLVQHRLRVSEQADDVIQQTLLHAFARREQLRTPDKFKNWLCSIALNEVRMFHRSARPGFSLDEFPSFELPDRRPSQHTQCEHAEMERHLRAGLAKLNERDRTAIHLADIHELTAEQAARRLAVSKAAFKSTHFRARQRLGRALRQVA